MENKNILCSVNDCANHSKCENYCSLSAINVGTPEQHPQSCSCTQCNSFVPCDCGCQHK